MKRIMKRTCADVIFDTCNIIFMILIFLIVAYPLYFVIIASVSDPAEVAGGNVRFWVEGFTLDPYKYILEHDEVWTGYANTLLYTVAGTAVSMLLTLPTAYTLSKKHLPGRNFFSWYFLITMYFGGGLIPNYLLIRSLNLLNKPITLIVLSGLSIYNMIVTRVYFQSSVPEELYEAARIDGASDFRQFFQLALPLATPIIAVITLYYVVGNWNSYFVALIYISDPKYYPLQMILRNILIENQTAINAIMDGNSQLVDEDHIQFLMRQAQMAEAMKYSLIIIASVPLLVAYPFVQKYFVKGVMIGSLKG